MKHLKMYCLTLNDSHLNKIKRLNYIPVGLGKDILSKEFLRDNSGDNISEKNHERCREVAEMLMRKNGYSITFSINLYSKDQDIKTQCEEIDSIYQKVGLPKDQQYRIRVSPAFPIVGGESNIYLPIQDYPKLGRKMFQLLKRFPQMAFRFDCSFPPCFLDEIEADETDLVQRFYFHGFKRGHDFISFFRRD